MKQNIHPQFNTAAVVTCACGNSLPPVLPRRHFTLKFAANAIRFTPANKSFWMPPVP